MMTNVLMKIDMTDSHDEEEKMIKKVQVIL